MCERALSPEGCEGASKGALMDSDQAQGSWGACVETAHLSSSLQATALLLHASSVCPHRRYTELAGARSQAVEPLEQGKSPDTGCICLKFPWEVHYPY